MLCFKRTPASEMRISDWRSDVCSSDLRNGNRTAWAFAAISDADRIRDRSARRACGACQRGRCAVGGGGHLLCHRPDRSGVPAPAIHAGDPAAVLGAGRRDRRDGGDPLAAPGGSANAGPHRRRLDDRGGGKHRARQRSEEHTSELQSLMRISYAVFCLKKKNKENETK